jgi:hypothetical protein
MERQRFPIDAVLLCRQSGRGSAVDEVYVAEEAAALQMHAAVSVL